MSLSAQLGRYLIGLAVTALGVQSVWLKIYVGRLQPVPAWVPGHAAIATLTGIFLIAAGEREVARAFAHAEIPASSRQRASRDAREAPGLTSLRKPPRQLHRSVRLIESIGIGDEHAAPGIDR